MRILHIETRHRLGGAEGNVIHTAMWERQQGHEVHLAVGRDSLVDLIPKPLQVHRIGDLVREVSPVADARAFFAIRHLIAHAGFDIVHTHQSKAGVIGRLAAKDRRALIVHTVHMSSFGNAYSRFGSAAFLRAERYCAGFTDAIVTVGDELRRMYLAAGVGKPEQYLVVRSPIDIGLFAGVRSWNGPRKTHMRARFGLMGGPVALVVSTLEPRKRVDLVISALAPALRGRGLTLAVAGDGPDRGMIADLGRTLGVGDRIRLLGHVSDAPALFGVADVLVHAAKVEGVPQVVIQALAAGLPVVATDMLGLREIPDAPVVIVPRDGTGLGPAVERAVMDPPLPSPLAAFDEWLPERVDQRLEALHVSLRVQRATSGVTQP